MGKKKAGGGENKEKGSITVVLKFDCLCEGCTTKINKHIHDFEGVETVKIDVGSNKVTVVGAVDPTAIRERLLKKIKKKVELVSPQPKKDDGNKEEKKPDKEKPQDSETKPEKKPKEKPKGAPVTTADLKVQLKCKCDGCIDKIRKIVAETKGVEELKVDKQKELVTVKGTMDVNALAKALKDKLKKNVEIVPPKKEKDDKNEGGENGGGGGKKKKGGDGGNDQANTGGDKVEGNRMDLMPQQNFGHMPVYPGYMPVHPGYGHPSYGYGYGQMHPYSPGHGHGHGYPGYVPSYPVPAHPPHQMFSDENPNACAIM